MSTLFFLWMNAALAALTIGLVQRLPPSWSVLNRLVGAALFLVLIPPFVLIAVNLFAPVTALTSALAITALVAVDRIIGRADTPTDSGEVAKRDWPDGVGVASLGAIGGFWGGATLWGGTHFVWDDLTYHAASPGWWMKTASLEVAPFTYQSYFPFNAELLSLWLMLPFSHDVHVNVGVFLWMSLAAMSAIAIATSIGQTRAGAMCWTALFLAVPTVRNLAYSFAPTDLAVSSLALAALSFAVLGEGSTGRERRVAAVMSGLAIGGAVGTKVIIVSTAAMLLLWWAWVVWRDRHGERWVWPLALFFGCAVFAGGWWYLRNLILVGNPLFPAEIGPLGGPFDRGAQYDTSMIPFLVEGWATPDFWFTLVGLRWDWPLLVGFASILGALGAVIRPPGRSRSGRFLGLVVIAILVAFPFTPFSGTANRPDFGLHDYQRYLTFPFGLGLVLAGSLLPQDRREARIYVGVPTALLLYVRWGLTVAEIGTGLIGASLALIVWIASTDPQGAAVFRRREFPRVASAFALIFLALHTPLQRARADANLFAFGSVRIDTGLEAHASWRVLERLPAGSRVGYYTYLPHNNRFFYPQFGRSFHLDPIPLTEEGMPLGPLHERWRAQSGGWWDQFDVKTQLDGEIFVANLAASDIDFVMVTQCQGAFPWPRQRTWLMASTTALLLHGDWCSEIWDLRDGGEAVILDDLGIVGKEATDREDRKRPKRKKRKRSP